MMDSTGGGRGGGEGGSSADWRGVVVKYNDELDGALRPMVQREGGGVVGQMQRIHSSTVNGVAREPKHPK